MQKKIFIYSLGLAIALFLNACASRPSKPQPNGVNAGASKSSGSEGKLSREWIDSSTHKNQPPAWVDDSRLVWKQPDKIFFRSVHTVRAQEGEARCFGLAQRESQETFLTEIASDIRGTLDTASLHLNSKAEAILTKLTSGETESAPPKLKTVEKYFEKYRMGAEERMDCHLLSEVATKQYEHFEAGVLSSLEREDPAFKTAIDRGKVRFFESKVKTGLKPLKQN